MEEKLDTGTKGTSEIPNKPYLCEYCLKSFRLLAYLETHMRTHTGEKPYECCFCGKRFASWPNMNRHKRIHTGARPYKCKLCSKSFNQPAVYNEHVKQHTGEKPFKCSYCNMAFSRQSRLTAHLRTHTGERPFVCDICQKSFVQSHHLVAHKRVHTKEKPYNCSLCSIDFTSSSNLIRHFRRIHDGITPPILPIVSLPSEEDAPVVQLSERVQELEELSITSSKVQIRGTVILKTPGGARRLKSYVTSSSEFSNKALTVNLNTSSENTDLTNISEKAATYLIDLGDKNICNDSSQLNSNLSDSSTSHKNIEKTVFSPPSMQLFYAGSEFLNSLKLGTFEQNQKLDSSTQSSSVCRFSNQPAYPVIFPVGKVLALPCSNQFLPNPAVLVIPTNIPPESAPFNVHSLVQANNL